MATAFVFAFAALGLGIGRAQDQGAEAKQQEWDTGFHGPIPVDLLRWWRNGNDPQESHENLAAE
jgi:hypothetical protein